MCTLITQQVYHYVYVCSTNVKSASVPVVGFFFPPKVQTEYFTLPYLHPTNQLLGFEIELSCTICEN